MRSYCNISLQINYKDYFVTIYKFFNKSDYKYCFKISFKANFVDNFYTSQQSFTTKDIALKYAKQYVDSLILFSNKREENYRQRKLIGVARYRDCDYAKDDKNKKMLNFYK